MLHICAQINEQLHDNYMLKKKYGNDIQVDPNYLSGEKPRRGDIDQRRVKPYEYGALPPGSPEGAT